MWDEGRDQGLHFFHVEAQHHSERKVAAFLRRHGVTFPNPILDESDFLLLDTGAPFGWGYDCRKLPKTYVIGVEGRVIWEGGFGYDEVLKKELAKVRYPGLFQQEVARGLAPAAKAFGAGKLGKALAEAERTQASLRDGEGAAADAQLIVRRAQEVERHLRAEAGAARQERRYAAALARLEEISARFAGHSLGEAAAAELKELARDAGVKRELQASRELDELFAPGAGDAAKLAEQLLAFARRNDGLHAAEEALFLAAGLE